MTSHEPLGGVVARRDTPFADFPMPPRYREYNVIVYHVNDGDSVKVILEDDDGRCWWVVVRYEHANAPEKTETGGKETWDFNASLCASKNGYIRTRGKRDDRSRLLGDIFMYTGKTTPAIDVSKLVSKFVSDNGYGTGN